MSERTFEWISLDPKDPPARNKRLKTSVGPVNHRAVKVNFLGEDIFFQVGDFCSVNSGKAKPYVGRIDGLIEANKQKSAIMQWMYRTPEDVDAKIRPPASEPYLQGELLFSPTHKDSVPLSTLINHVEIVFSPRAELQSSKPNEDCYLCYRSYDRVKIGHLLPSKMVELRADIRTNQERLEAYKTRPAPLSSQIPSSPEPTIVSDTDEIAAADSDNAALDDDDDAVNGPSPPLSSFPSAAAATPPTAESPTAPAPQSPQHEQQGQSRAKVAAPRVGERYQCKLPDLSPFPSSLEDLEDQTVYKPFRDTAGAAAAAAAAPALERGSLFALRLDSGTCWMRAIGPPVDDQVSCVPFSDCWPRRLHEPGSFEAQRVITVPTSMVLFPLEALVDAPLAATCRGPMHVFAEWTEMEVDMLFANLVEQRRRFLPDLPDFARLRAVDSRFRLKSASQVVEFFCLVAGRQRAAAQCSICGVPAQEPLLACSRISACGMCCCRRCFELHQAAHSTLLDHYAGEEDGAWTEALGGVWLCATCTHTKTALPVREPDIRLVEWQGGYDPLHYLPWSGHRAKSFVDAISFLKQAKAKETPDVFAALVEALNRFDRDEVDEKQLMTLVRQSLDGADTWLQAELATWWAE